MKRIDHPHKRFNALNGEWILVSPHRSKRPWQGHQEKVMNTESSASYEKCYLCPGNTRSNGEHNPKYKDTFSFTNDFSALLPEYTGEEVNESGLFYARPVRGLCRVLCFSPDHHLTIPLMDVNAIFKVIELWKKEYSEISKIEWIRHIQIFENKGEIMGCSNPHPHGQIWAQDDQPAEVKKESNEQQKFFEKNGVSLLSCYLQKEIEHKERIVCSNEDFVALVPYWATWPFETMIISRRHFQNINEMNERETHSFAEILKRLTTKYDNLFLTSFPYSAGMHQGPVNDGHHPEWHWHMHFYPPLLRSATIKKFMVGYELLANPQRDITPEVAAEMLTEQSEVHYTLLKA
jgi:UDPglucose--hexose-1-phosphate uridylyltransferase